MLLGRHGRIFGIATWSVAVLAGYLWLTAHQFDAVVTRLPAHTYPTGAPALAPGQATLFMFIHPKCPCTQASLAELSDILSTTGTGLVALVYVYTPHDAEPDWHTGANWDAASALPGVSVQLDTDGKLARLFEAATSGATVVYDQSGKLAYAGGITAQRGHEGPSTGGDAVMDIANGRPPRVQSMPVFGCSLFDDVTTLESGQ